MQKKGKIIQPPYIWKPIMTKTERGKMPNRMNQKGYVNN